MGREGRETDEQKKKEAGKGKREEELEKEDEGKRKIKEEEQRVGSKNSEEGNYPWRNIGLSLSYSHFKESKSKETKQFIERCSSERNNRDCNLQTQFKPSYNSFYFLIQVLIIS